MAPSDVWLSFFARDTRPQAAASRAEDWSELVARLSDPEPSAIPKKDLPLWSAAKFRGDYRKRANVESVHLLCYDVDVEPIPSADGLRSALAGKKAVVHSSSRATQDAPRWRVALALSRPVSADEYDRLWHTGAADFAPAFVVGGESKDPSRGWYFPREGPDGFFECFETPGEAIDVDAVLARANPAPITPNLVKNEARTTSGTTSAINPTTDRATRIAATRAAAAVMLGKAWPATGRHQAQLALAGALKRDGWDPDDALDFVCSVCREAGDEDRPKRTATIRDTWAKETITGWGALEGHVDRTIVSEARRALNVHAADFAALRATLRPASAENPTGRMRPAERARKVGGDGTSRLTTGLPSVDTATRGGLLLRKLVAIGGAPGAGKTAAMISLAYRWLEAGIPVAVLAADEDADALLIRFGQLGGLSRDALEAGDPRARDALAAWCERVPLILADGDDENATIETVSAELRAVAGPLPAPSVLVVDSMQTVRSEDTPPRDVDVRARINHTVRALKRAAKVDGHLVIASSELSKAAYRNKAQAENVNALSAFKESGDIEYGVALALVLISRHGTSELVDASIVKNRLGPGKPELVLKLDHDRANVTETTAADLTKSDPLYFLKQEILGLIDDAVGAPLSKNALHTKIGGAKTRLLRAVSELVDAHTLFEAKGGVRRPLPGEPGYSDSATGEQS